VQRKLIFSLYAPHGTNKVKGIVTFIMNFHTSWR